MVRSENRHAKARHRMGPEHVNTAALPKVLQLMSAARATSTESPAQYSFLSLLLHRCKHHRDPVFRSIESCRVGHCVP